MCFAISKRSSINTSVTTPTANARPNNVATIFDAKAVWHLIVKDKLNLFPFFLNMVVNSLDDNNTSVIQGLLLA